MVGDIVAEPGDQERWSRAESLVAQQPPVDTRQGPWRRRIRAWALALGVVVLAAAATTLWARIAHGPGRWEGLVAGVSLGYGGLLLVIAIGLMEPPRYKGRVRMWGSPQAALSARQTRILLDEVVGRRPVDPDHLALARDLAMRRMEQALRQAPLSLATVLVVFGSQITSGDALMRWLSLVLPFAFALAVVIFARDMRRYRRFLRENPTPPERSQCS